jgi:dihydrofolate synthase/folylpolyglutamate synthase
MDYAECLQYLRGLGDEVLTMRLGLGPFRTLLGQLAHPHLQFPSVIVAGTNGKGSVTRCLGSIMSSCGVKTAVFTSPHVLRLEERFAVDGEAITPQEFSQCFSSVAEAIRNSDLRFHPTYFETVTATAFLFFARRQVDLAILEVGMGGRLDSTNVVDPQLSIITRIGLDHQAQLGGTVEEIAVEKAGVLRSGAPVLLSPQRKEVRQVLGEQAGHVGAPVHDLDLRELHPSEDRQGRYSFFFRGTKYRLGVYGRHQIENAAMAIQASQLLQSQGFSGDDSGVRKGVEAAWSPGVVQKIEGNPAVFLDGGHNRDAVGSLADFVREHIPPPRSLVFGIMGDKDVEVVLGILAPHFEQIYLTTFNSARVADSQRLTAACPHGVLESDPLRALSRALQTGADTVVAGSFYLVGEILAGIEEKKVNWDRPVPTRRGDLPS